MLTMKNGQFIVGNRKLGQMVRFKVVGRPSVSSYRVRVADEEYFHNFETNVSFQEDKWYVGDAVRCNFAMIKPPRTTYSGVATCLYSSYGAAVFASPDCDFWIEVSGYSFEIGKSYHIQNTPGGWVITPKSQETFDCRGDTLIFKGKPIADASIRILDRAGRTGKYCGQIVTIPNQVDLPRCDSIILFCSNGKLKAIAKTKTIKFKYGCIIGGAKNYGREVQFTLCETHEKSRRTLLIIEIGDKRYHWTVPTNRISELQLGRVYRLVVERQQITRYTAITKWEIKPLRRRIYFNNGFRFTATFGKNGLVINN